ncbi:hypothetical protein JCM10213_003199 [Rhodosporidiobolus nylandii]
MVSEAFPCPPSSFVPYLTPSFSPQHLHYAREQPHRTGMAVPPIQVSMATPSPPSPPLPPISSLAQFAAEMFVWLWFAPSTEGGAGEAGEASGIGKLQVKPTERFLRFCNEVLTTTQVSHSVVLLALLFISRLKQRNTINGAPGSEYRLAVTGLMLANKVLDDNTYTAQTWSQVSSLELKPLVAGEAEFLKGLDWSLHITKRDYDAWLKLLEGHVAARNMRIGRGPCSASLIPSSRKIASSKRVRAALVGDLHGLGIEGAAPQLQLPASEKDDSRRVRRRIEGSVSTHTTPTSSFATFTLPAPSTAPHPHPRASAPLPSYSYQPPHSATAMTFPSLDVSPTSLAYTARRSSGSTTKRRADDAFTSGAYPAASMMHPPYVAPSDGAMSRSFSAAPATAFVPVPPAGVQGAPPPLPLQHPFVHPAHYVPILPLPIASSPLASRPSSSSSTASSYFPSLPTSFAGPAYPHPPPPPPHGAGVATPFGTLSDAFSPRYDPEQQRRLRQGTVSLGYYSLAAGQALGHLRQTLPLPPLAQSAAAMPLGYAPHHPSGLSTVSTCPASEAYAHPHPQHPHAYPTPAMSSFGSYPAPTPAGAAMLPSFSAQSFSSAAPRLAGGMSHSSPPRMYSPPSSAGTGAYQASSLPPHLLPQPRHPQPPMLPPQPQGPHPYYSSYSNAGVPGVFWRAG